MGKKGGRAGWGTIYLHKGARRWCAELYLVKSPAGKRQVWRYCAPGPTDTDKADAEAKLARAIVERGRGTPLLVERQTVGEYLDYWLKEVV